MSSSSAFKRSAPQLQPDECGLPGSARSFHLNDGWEEKEISKRGFQALSSRAKLCTDKSLVTVSSLACTRRLAAMLHLVRQMAS